MQIVCFPMRRLIFRPFKDDIYMSAVLVWVADVVKSFTDKSICVVNVTEYVAPLDIWMDGSACEVEENEYDLVLFPKWFVFLVCGSTR